MTRPEIHVVSRRRRRENIREEFPEAEIIDLSSRGDEPWRRFSPFYPHGSIPVPYCADRRASCVEGIWQGLKVFEHADVDPRKFDITTMRGIKRSVRKYGPCRGHQRGLESEELLGYADARWQIYLPSYHFVLRERLATQCDRLRALASQRELVFLDYGTNGNVDDLSRPLSHAALARAYLLEQWPVRS